VSQAISSILGSIMKGQQFTEISTQNISQRKESLERAYKNYRLQVWFAFFYNQSFKIWK
jgi:hypothetical protein